MQGITQVTYSRLVSFGNYENETVEATAGVAAEENPAERLAELKQWVSAQLEAKVIQEEKLTNKFELERELEDYQFALNQMREKWEASKAFLEKHGIDTSKYEPVPF